MAASGFQIKVFQVAFPEVCCTKPGQRHSKKKWSFLGCFLLSESWVLWFTPWHKPSCFPEKATIIKDNNTFLWLQQAHVTTGSSLSFFFFFLHRLENTLLVFLFKFLCLVSLALKITASFLPLSYMDECFGKLCSIKLKHVFTFFLRSETPYM